MVQHKQAFTLIELLVVVLIIGILTAVALPQYQKAVLKSRLVQLQIRADAIYKAGQVYLLANGEYPTDISELDIDISTGGTLQKTTSSQGEHKGVVWEDGSSCAIVFPDIGMIWCKNEDFSLGIRSDGVKRLCYGRHTFAQEVCRSLAVGDPKQDGAYPLN